MLTDILCAAAVRRLKNCWRILLSCGKQENSQCCCDLHCFGRGNAEEMYNGISFSQIGGEAGTWHRD